MLNACLLCGSRVIDATENGRFHTMRCHDCEAVLLIELDPPDAPDLRGRIELIQEPTAVSLNQPQLVRQG